METYAFHLTEEEKSKFLATDLIKTQLLDRPLRIANKSNTMGMFARKIKNIPPYNDLRRELHNLRKQMRNYLKQLTEIPHHTGILAINIMPFDGFVGFGILVVQMSPHWTMDHIDLLIKHAHLVQEILADHPTYREFNYGPKTQIQPWGVYYVDKNHPVWNSTLFCESKHHETDVQIVEHSLNPFDYIPTSLKRITSSIFTKKEEKAVQPRQSVLWNEEASVVGLFLLYLDLSHDTEKILNQIRDHVTLISTYLKDTTQHPVYHANIAYSKGFAGFGSCILSHGDQCHNDQVWKEIFTYQKQVQMLLKIYSKTFHEVYLGLEVKHLKPAQILPSQHLTSSSVHWVQTERQFQTYVPLKYQKPELLAGQKDIMNSFHHPS